MRGPDRDRDARTSTGLDLTSPALWAFLGEFPAAGLALGAWMHDQHDGHDVAQWSTATACDERR